MKILIAHDWPVFRAGIIQILRGEFGPLNVTQMSITAEGFNLASGPWDLAFVDVDLADRAGLHFVTKLKRV